MLPEFLANTAVGLTFDTTGFVPEAYRVEDEHHTILKQEATDKPVGNSLALMIEKDLNQLDKGTKAFRSVLLLDENGVELSRQSYIVKASEEIQVGLNSFATPGELYLKALDLPELDVLVNEEKQARDRALISAYHHFSKITVSLDNVDLGDDRRFSGSPLLLDLDKLATDCPRLLDALKLAQVIEANFILGGNPVEHHRRLGLMSNSAGESAQMFRTGKPLELPICRDAAIALAGFITYAKPIGINTRAVERENNL